MRDIKFRTWNGKEIEYFTLDNNFDCVSGWLDGKILMQYTGLKDKKGVEIYNGDILTIGQNLIGEIIYIDKNTQDWGDEIHAAFHSKIYRHNKIIPIDSYLLNDCKIIGNIHENPELI